MDPAAIAGLCALLARGQVAGPLPEGVTCPAVAVSPVLPTTPQFDVGLGRAIAAPGARDGIARVAYAEAGNQGDSGLAGVVYTILNRLQDGRWGGSIDAVLNARSQFEPVMRAGGDWRRLPPVSAAAQTRIDTILNLALEGRLPDLTHGARYFQNPVIVAGRARAGQVSAGLVNFGGAAPSAVIGAHSFYAETGRAGGSGRASGVAGRMAQPDAIFVGENRVGPASAGDNGPAAGDQPQGPPPTSLGAPSGDPSRALFVSRDGRVRAGEP
jgi:N-acetylmuramoyl-L-alanine amidase